MVKTDKLADEMRELLYPHQREMVEWLFASGDRDFPADDGRRWSPLNDMQAVLPRWGEDVVDPATAIHEFLNRFLTEGEATLVVPVNGDYSPLEMYALATILHESGDNIFIDIDDPSGQLAGMVKLPVCKTEVPEKSYLDHDPTKRHKRRKRK